jgi:diguanylate cyclase (GGDEF)-like protein
MREWLCPTELDRARVTEASDRVRRARVVTAGGVGLSLLLVAPWLGWWTFGLFAVAVANLATLERRFAGSNAPELVAAKSLLLTTVLLAVAAALSGGAHSPLLPWLVIPVGMAATRFRAAVVQGYAELTAIVILFVALAPHPEAATEDPVPLVVALSLLLGLAAITAALTRAELKHRDAAVLDPLTGLLNRQALETRVVELEQQARLTGASVCFVACDLDHFKVINDTHGHERGDLVLRDVAYEIRKALGSFELAYRLGGEEFLIILPGVGLEEGRAVAERLRATIAAARPGRLEITMSAGVSAAAGGEVSHMELFRAADAALYDAKRGGRNRVIVTTPAATPSSLPAPALAPA